MKPGDTMRSSQDNPLKGIIQLPKERTKEREAFIINLVDEAPYPLFVINPDLSIRYVNPAFEELMGFTLEELVGQKPPYPWWYGDTEAKIKDLMTTVLSGVSKIERCNVKKNGEFVWVQLSGRPVYVNGELKYFLSNWVDITERKKNEAQLNRLNQELRNLTAHLDSIREEERSNISRMIHDEIGQALTALKMDTCWIKNNLANNQKTLSDTAESMVKLLDATFHKVRWISTVLRPIWLDDLGLPETLKWLVEEFQEMTSIKCRINVGKNIKLDKQISTAIYRIFQETLTNIFRHSKASEVNVSLIHRKNRIELIVADNGIGILHSKIISKKSFGIIGMRERAEFLGGSFEIVSKKNKGTSIIVTLPAQLSSKED
jgi:PAS domain S-box-containing protein